MYKYKLLEKIQREFSIYKKDDIDRVYIFACQHILEPQQKMFALISDLGIKKENIFILGKVYSENIEISKELKQEGFKVQKNIFQKNNSFDEQHHKNCTNLSSFLLKKIKNASKIIVLDDGGELLKVINDISHKISSQDLDKIIGIEQTSSGFRKLEEKKLNFPIINVARSKIKLVKESPVIVNYGFKRFLEFIKENKLENKDLKILVIGLGPIGRNMFNILRSKKFKVIGHDKKFAKYENSTSCIKNNNVDIVIGATGSNVISSVDIEEINKNINKKLFLISVSSSDREFPSKYIRIKSNFKGNIHDTVEYKNIILVNNGFPITFKGKRIEALPKDMEKTIALLFGSVLFAIFNKKKLFNKFIRVPKHIADLINP